MLRNIEELLGILVILLVMPPFWLAAWLLGGRR